MRIEKLISYLLRAGIILSALFLATGFILYLPVSSADISSIEYAETFRTGFLELNLTDLAVNPLSYMFAGILILMSTPVLRVALTIYLFAYEKDWKYVSISAVVLLIIVLSISLSLSH